MTTSSPLIFCCLILASLLFQSKIYSFRGLVLADTFHHRVQTVTEFDCAQQCAIDPAGPKAGSAPTLGLNLTAAHWPKCLHAGEALFRWSTNNKSKNNSEGNSQISQQFCAFSPDNFRSDEVSLDLESGLAFLREKHCFPAENKSRVAFEFRCPNGKWKSGEIFVVRQENDVKN